MTGQDQGLYRSGEFAAVAGVTVRTLRFYDQKGLLSPSFHSETGHRLYSIRDLARLEQIQALKFIGLSLAEIRFLLAENEPDFGRSLRAQRLALSKKTEHLRRVIKAIDEVERSIQDGRPWDWSCLARIIKVIQMEKHADWFKNYYSKEQLDQLAQRPWTPEDQAAIEVEWNNLYAEVRRNINQPPSSPEVQALAGKWLELIGRFTQGDPGLTANLNRAYAEMNQAPAEVRAEFQKNRDVYAFMDKAIALYRQEHPQH